MRGTATRRLSPRPPARLAERERCRRGRPAAPARPARSPAPGRPRRRCAAAGPLRTAAASSRTPSPAAASSGASGAANGSAASRARIASTARCTAPAAGGGLVGDPAVAQDERRPDDGGEELGVGQVRGAPQHLDRRPGFERPQPPVAARPRGTRRRARRPAPRPRARARAPSRPAAPASPSRRSRRRTTRGGPARRRTGGARRLGGELGRPLPGRPGGAARRVDVENVGTQPRGCRPDRAAAAGRRSAAAAARPAAAGRVRAVQRAHPAPTVAEPTCTTGSAGSRRPARRRGSRRRGRWAEGAGREQRVAPDSSSTATPRRLTATRAVASTRPPARRATAGRGRTGSRSPGAPSRSPTRDGAARQRAGDHGAGARIVKARSIQSRTGAAASGAGSRPASGPGRPAGPAPRRRCGADGDRRDVAQRGGAIRSRRRRSPAPGRRGRPWSPPAGVPHPEGVEGGEVLGGLRRPALVGGDHDQRGRAPGRRRRACCHEPLVPGDVDERDRRPDGSVVQAKPRSMVMPRRRSSGPAVGFHPGQGADQRRLAVVDVAGGGDTFMPVTGRRPARTRGQGVVVGGGTLRRFSRRGRRPGSRPPAACRPQRLGEPCGPAAPTTAVDVRAPPPPTTRASRPRRRRRRRRREARGERPAAPAAPPRSAASISCTGGSGPRSVASSAARVVLSTRSAR